MKSFSRILVAMVVLAFIAMAAFLYRYYDRVFNKPEAELIESNQQAKKPAKTKQKSQISKTSTNLSELIFPLSEKKLKIDFVDPNAPKVKDKIIVTNLSDEILFCLREVLEDEKVEFAYHRQSQGDGALIDIVIYLGSKAKRVERLLDYYEIPHR